MPCKVQRDKKVLYQTSIRIRSALYGGRQVDGRGTAADGTRGRDQATAAQLTSAQGFGRLGRFHLLAGRPHCAPQSQLLCSIDGTHAISRVNGGTTAGSTWSFTTAVQRHRLSADCAAKSRVKAAPLLWWLWTLFVSRSTRTPARDITQGHLSHLGETTHDRRRIMIHCVRADTGCDRDSRFSPSLRMHQNRTCHTDKSVAAVAPHGTALMHLKRSHVTP